MKKGYAWAMKTTCLALALSWVLSASAAFALDVKPLVGDFVFGDQMELVSARRVQVVPQGFSDAGSATIRGLQSQGYTCEHVYDGNFRCVLFLHDTGIPPKVRSQLERANEGLKMTFAEPVGTPELVTDGDDFKEYEVAQLGVAAGRKFESYRLQFLLDRGTVIEKVALTTTEDQMTEWRFRRTEAGDLGFWADTSVGDSTGWTAYTVELVLKKSP